MIDQSGGVRIKSGFADDRRCIRRTTDRISVLADTVLIGVEHRRSSAEAVVPRPLSEYVCREGVGVTWRTGLLILGSIALLTLLVGLGDEQATAQVDGRTFPLACPDDYYVTSASFAPQAGTRFGSTREEATNPFSPDERLPSEASSVDAAGDAYATSPDNPRVVYLTSKTDLGYVVDSVVWCGEGDDDLAPEEIRWFFGR